jgi:hypothetical protein
VNKITFVIGFTILLIVIFFSGCTESNNSNDETILSGFVGTWTGNLVSTFKGRTANITGLTFIENTVDVTMNSDRGTNTMAYTYTVEGEKLVLDVKFENDRRQTNRQPPEGGQSSMSISFFYSFNEEYDVLYLNEKEFVKV